MSKRSIDRVYNDRLQEHSGIKRNKKACTECRQQKVRCNATTDSKDPCSRCRRMGLTCVISDPFKREHKRQRLFDLEKEAFELRQRLETQTVWGNGLPPTPTTSNMDPSITMTPIMSNSSTSPPAHINSMVSPPAEPHEIVATPTSPAGTQSRSLDGVLVSATEIDELFQVYFQDLHQFLPILDSKHTPNHYYDKSPLLFWAVLAVASRTYSKDPTLLDSLGERVLNLGLLSLRTPTVTNIKGLLLILTWPLAKAAGADTTYAISGTILHMAMQIGLHIPTSSQDFSRVKVNLTETQIIKRAELWGYCIVTYQRSCSFKGYSPLALMETYQDSEQRHTLFQRISQSLRLQLRLNGVLTRCQSAILQNGLRVMSKDQEHALEILIRVFEATLKDVEPDAISDLDKLYLYTARLTIQAFHFYKDPAKKLPTFMLTRLYTTAHVLLRHIDRMDSSGVIKLSNAPSYFFYATSLASFTILRLLKASTAQYMDENAKEGFFLGVNVMKRLSTESNDGPARIVMMLTQLWNSEKAFRNPDGTEHMALRIRTRLAMSAVFDSIWWWREEFGGMRGAYTDEEKPNLQQENKGLLIQEDPILGKGQTEFPVLAVPNQQIQDLSTFLDENLLAELGWTNSNFNFYPPVPGAYNAEWYSPTDLNGFAI